MTRGEVWLAALDPARGSEQAGTRPVLILQADPLNEFLRTVVVIQHALGSLSVLCVRVSGRRGIGERFGGVVSP
jgi:mRNA-degrading endonuclease toxin of MazEF toxin-antitoxin module